MIPEHWREIEIRDTVLRLDAGASVLSEERMITNGEIGVLKVSAVSYGRFMPQAHKAVTIPTQIERLTVIPLKGTLLVSRANTYELVGASAYVENDYPDLFLSDKLWRIQTTEECDALWLSYVLSAANTRARIADRATGTSGSMKNISQSAFLSIKIPFPPFPEQRKIAEILGTWDAAIGRVEQLIAALQRRKQGLMQRLLTGAVRFPEFVGTEWEELRLGEFLRYAPRKVEKPASSYVRMGIRSHGKGTFTEIIDDPTSNAMDFLYEVKGDDLIVNITFAWEQAIAIVDAKDAGALVSHRFPTYEFDRTKVVSEFFRYLMLTERFHDKLELITPGGAGRNRVMSKPDFLKLTVRVPSVKEQQRIGEVLMATDKAIDTYQQYLAALSQQKKGLMQRLLTGQVRVKVAEQ